MPSVIYGIAAAQNAHRSPLRSGNKAIRNSMIEREAIANAPAHRRQPPPERLPSLVFDTRSRLPPEALRRRLPRQAEVAPKAESLHFQHHERYVVILRPPVRPAIARSDEVFDDLARVAGSGFGQ